MVLKSVPIDSMNVIVFAIRGSHSFQDWAINMNRSPTAPEGFLDDVGNLCHAGFLSVARQMIKPVAARLRQLLEESPSRTAFSLLISGHSAGGAVASLLFAHMLSETVSSDLTNLRDAFKRVHCITFGSPPVSILPLTKPSNPRYDKWLFFSFINEGDPVPRCEGAYIRSLLELCMSPTPPTGEDLDDRTPLKNRLLGGKERRQSKSAAGKEKRETEPVVWNTPPGTLTPAGRLILLRESKQGDVEACLLSCEDLRLVIFGDPLMHVMDLYARRIETLATDVVTTRAFRR